QQDGHDQDDGSARGADDQDHLVLGLGAARGQRIEFVDGFGLGLRGGFRRGLGGGRLARPGGDARRLDRLPASRALDPVLQLRVADEELVAAAAFEIDSCHGLALREPVGINKLYSPNQGASASLLNIWTPVRVPPMTARSNLPEPWCVLPNAALGVTIA